MNRRKYGYNWHLREKCRDMLGRIVIEQCRIDENDQKDLSEKVSKCAGEILTQVLKVSLLGKMCLTMNENWKLPKIAN